MLIKNKIFLHNTLTKAVSVHECNLKFRFQNTPPIESDEKYTVIREKKITENSQGHSFVIKTLKWENVCSADAILIMCFKCLRQALSGLIGYLVVLVDLSPYLLEIKPVKAQRHQRENADKGSWFNSYGVTHFTMCSSHTETIWLIIGKLSDSNAYVFPVW